ncbi:hypothetical protein DM56_4576 [Burkholderia mallei]|nr:hypothetical protein DM45_670 [Burkholderia mallei]KOT05078.1 hypothetical protein DM56_4576 [Burkholderia mallei]KOT10226.1 hypothetical protein DM77_197 [Burkholderia mallei]
MSRRKRLITGFELIVARAHFVPAGTLGHCRQQAVGMVNDVRVIEKANLRIIPMPGEQLCTEIAMPAVRHADHEQNRTLLGELAQTVEQRRPICNMLQRIDN